MSFVDKFKFWKKNDDFGDIGRDFDFPKGPLNEPLSEPTENFGENMGGPSFEQPNMQQQPLVQPNFQSQPQASDSMGGNELIMSKLDTIKAQLDTLNARIANLERIANGSR